ncbi:hypothetical protein EON65_03840 [archaeon]|nr:MAG: hypothetical protein EON65_03840 [archaeon]
MEELDPNTAEDEPLDTKKIWEDFFNRNKPKVLIHPVDYLKESKVFLEKGNLHDAFQILSVGTSRGYLENVAIVLQMWTILTRMDREKDANDCLNFLISAVTVESARARAPVMRQVWTERPMLTDGEIPLCFVFIHCINYLMNLSLQTKKLTKRNHIMSQLLSLLGECYFLYCGEKETSMPKLLAWFNAPPLWVEMAEQLENSLFILLAEDSYYEAYRRHPASNVAISRMVESMERYHRETMVPHVLTRAIALNPWNIYVRDKLLEYEARYHENIKEQRWKRLFDSEYAEMRKIQSLVRGWLLRCAWPGMLPRLQEIRREFLLKMTLSTERYEQFWVKYMKELYGRWVVYRDERVALKNLCAVRLQTLTRKVSKMMIFRALLNRSQQANANYLVASQVLYNRTLITTLRVWYDHYIMRRKHASANVIRDVLWLQGYNQLLVKGMNEVMLILRVRYKYLKKRILQHWVVRYQNKRMMWARVSIRFFVRGVYSRLWDREEEQKLKIVEEMVAEQKEVAYIKNQFPIMMEMWTRWRKKYLYTVQQKAIINMAYTLQHCYYTYKAKLIMSAKRVRRDCQVAYMLRRVYVHKSRLFRIWRVGQAVRRIQRFVRIQLAKRVLKRRQCMHRGVNQMIYRRNTKTKRMIMFRFVKHTYLSKREIYRACKKLVTFFRKHFFLSILRCMLKRKARYVYFARALHNANLKKNFKELRVNCLYQAKYTSLSAMFYWALRRMKEINFTTLCKQTSRQSKLHKLTHLLIAQKIQRNYWVNAQHSVRVLTPTEEQLDVHSIRLDGIATWEKVIAPHRVLLSIHTVWPLQKAFRAFMCVYRQRHYYKRGSASDLASGVMCQIVESMGLRREKLLNIQCLYRSWAARRKHRTKYVQLRRVHEFVLKKEMFLQKMLYRRMLYISRLRQLARCRLQRRIRIYLAITHINARRSYVRRLQQCAAAVSTSRLQRTMVQKYMTRWHSAYVQSIVSQINDKDFDFEDYVAAYYKRHKTAKRSYVDYSDNDGFQQSDEDDDSDLNVRWKKLSKYQKKLQSRSVAKAHPTQSTSKINLSKKVQAHFPSASAMFFQSQAFHAMFSQISRSGVFTLHSSVLGQLAPQEIYYCLFHAYVVVVQDVQYSILKYVCEGFQGKKVILCNGRVNVKVVEELLVDLCTRRTMMHNHVLDRSKWPLTLPSSVPRGDKSSQAGIELIFQSVNVSLLASLRFAYGLQQYNDDCSHEAALNKSTTSDDNSTIAKVLGINSLSIDIESFQWSATIILLHSIANSPSLQTLTIEHMGQSGDTKVPEALEAAFTQLAKRSRLQVLILRGWFPVSVYFALAGALQSPTNFPFLSRLELQSQVGENVLVHSTAEMERITAVELLINLAKMRAYSSMQVGLSVVADFV